MNLTSTISLTNLRVQNTANMQNVVIQTHWTMTGTDPTSNLSGTFVGATPFDANTINANSFIDFANLTQNVVIGWITDTINNNPMYQQHINDSISNQIMLKINPVTNVTDNSFPWSANT